MTEAERRVIEASAPWLMHMFEEPEVDWGAAKEPMHDLRDAVLALLAERAAPASPPPAPAVDVAGLEKAADEALIAVGRVAMMANTNGFDAVPGELKEAARKAIEALAAARKPKPALLTAEEALTMYAPAATRIAGLHIVLSAATERFVAAVEGLRRSIGHRSDCAINNGPALPVGECDCGGEHVSLSDIRALGRSA